MLDNIKKTHLSHVYAYAVATSAGFFYEKTGNDNDMRSIDAHINADDTVGGGQWKFPVLELQLKATTHCNFNEQENNFRIEISIKNYNDLRGDRSVPAILVVLFLPNECSDWIKHTEDELIAKKCAYWISLRDHPPVDNTSNVTIKIPKSNIFSPGSLTDLMTKISSGVDV